MLWLYALIIVIFALGLWAAYKVLGTPSALTPPDYAIVLADIATTAERSATSLRQTLATPGRDLHGAATEARKIFQTGYYQAMRLRPASGPDLLADVRSELGLACEAYDWASRMVASAGVNNPLIEAAVLRLLDAGDAALRQAAKRLPASLPAPRESTAPSP